MVWLALAIPSFIARFLLRKERNLLGVLQDLFVGLQLSFLPLYLTPLFQLLILYDAVIDRRFHFRLGSTSFSFLFQLGDFKDSAKDLGVYRYFFPFLSLSLIPLLSPPSSSLLVFLGIPLLFIPASDNLIVLWEKELIGVCLKPFRKSKKSFSSFIKKELLSKGEISTFVSPNYPLFRYTHGFKGKVIAPIEGNKKPHVIFLFFESLRAREMEHFGGRKETLPHLNRLAKEGYFFPNFHANSLLTFRAFFTSHYGLPYSLKMKSGLEGSLPVWGLPNLLKEGGYQTNYITGSHFDIGGMGPFLRNQGVDFIFDKKDFRKRYQGSHQGSWGALDEHLFEVTLDHLEKHKETPQFYNLLTITSHHPWLVPPNYQGPTFDDIDSHHLPKYLPKYLQTLNYTDHCIGKFMEKLKERGLSNDVILFITGDHGIHIKENEIDHEFGRGGEKECFHVPLILYAEDRIQNPQVVETLGSHCDLLPTLMDLLHLQGYQHSIGKSLLREDPNPRIFFHSPVNLYNGVFCQEGDEVTNNLKGERLSPIVSSFREMMLWLFDEKKLAPPHLEKKGLQMEPVLPPHPLRERALAEYIKKKSPLISLNLNQHQGVDDTLLKKISKWNPHLSDLYINGSYRVTDKGIMTLIENCRALINLDLSNCMLLTKESLKKIPETIWTLSLKNLDFVDDDFFTREMESLHSLSLQRTPITVQGLKKVLSLTPTLAELSLSYTHFTVDEIREAISRCPIQRLHLEECYGLSDEEGQRLFAPHPYLTDLSINNCPALTDALFHSIETISIKHLTLQDVSHLTDKGFEKLLNLPLASLYVSSCVRLTEKSLDLAKKYTPKFKSISVDIFAGSLYKKN